MSPRTKDDLIELVITCPKCDHTHTIGIPESDLPLQKNSARERLYKLKEVGEIVGLSRRTLKQLIYDGKLKAQKLTDRGAWFVSASDLTSFRRSRSL